MRLDDVYLVDIIEAKESIVRMLGETSELDFVADEKLSAAVQMKLLIMGEALSSMTDETRNAFQNVPVAQVRGLRNRIVHGYFMLDNRLIYQIAVSHVPVMSAEAERLLLVLFPDTYNQLEKMRAQGVAE